MQAAAPVIHPPQVPDTPPTPSITPASPKLPRRSPRPPVERPLLSKSVPLGIAVTPQLGVIHFTRQGLDGWSSKARDGPALQGHDAVQRWTEP